jgi:hypothetical protein
MRHFSQVLTPCVSMEKDSKNNPTGMQLRIWKFNNETSILVRALKHDHEAIKVLYPGNKTNGEVNEIILEMLNKLKLVKNKTNWEYSTDGANLCITQDEFEERGDCMYWYWSVKKHLLINF